MCTFWWRDTFRWASETSDQTSNNIQLSIIDYRPCVSLFSHWGILLLPDTDSSLLRVCTSASNISQSCCSVNRKWNFSGVTFVLNVGLSITKTGFWYLPGRSVLVYMRFSSNFSPCSCPFYPPPSHRALEKVFGEHRSLMLTRSSFPGVGKYSGHWLGDNAANWNDIKWAIPGMLEFGLFGVPYVSKIPKPANTNALLPRQAWTCSG